MKKNPGLTLPIPSMVFPYGGAKVGKIGKKDKEVRSSWVMALDTVSTSQVVELIVVRR